MEVVPAIAENKPSKIFLEIGINDVKALPNVDSVLVDYETLVDFIRRRTPTTKIYIQTILPVSSTFERANDINGLVMEVNRRIRGEIPGVVVIDLHSSFNGELRPDFTTDGLHLSAAAYQEWMRIIGPYIYD
jgi:lysophospholipase L1-like esterase